MNDIFNFFSPLSFVKSGTVAYNPLINYDWSTTTTSGLRYLKDVGSTPTYNASMYFGRGAYLNGVDQTITVPINATIQTSLKRVNGIVTINETSQALTNYVISGLGVHKDYYLFTRLLTTAEKDSYTNTPELFYAMAQADSTCVLNMPMCETDGYVRNMKSYSEYELPYNNTRIGYTTSDYIRPIVADKTIVNNRIRIYDNSSTTNTPRFLLTTDSLAYNYSILEIDCYYKIEVKVGVVFEQSDIRLKYGTDTNLNGGVYYNNVNLADLQSHIIIIKSTNIKGRGIGLIANGSGTTETTSYFDVDYFIVTKLTGAYPITNYTSSVGDNAKNLQYGLQTCKFKRDSLGVIKSASNYLECDGVGYGNTGYLPIQNSIFTIDICLASYSLKQFGIGIGYDKVRIVILNNNVYIQANQVNGGILVQEKYVQGTYKNVTLVYNKGTLKGYINGVLIETKSGLVLTDTQYIPIGYTSENIGTGDIRLFKVHDKELTQAEITANFNSYVAKGLLS